MLVADIGNTDTVFGIFDGETLVHKLRLRSNAAEAEVFYNYYLRNFFLEKNIEPSLYQQGVFSSVVPGMNEMMENVFKELCESSIMVKPGIHPDIEVEIDRQDELGADIYCNAVGSYILFKQACIIVDFGTALTFTGVDENGTIKGVAIAPGIGTAIKSLFTQTAQLPEVPLNLPPSVMGTNTVTAIQSGILYGYEGMIKNLISKFKTELNVDAKVVATGGLSGVLHTLDSEFDLIDKDLTLKGLRLIGKNILSQS